MSESLRLFAKTTKHPPRPRAGVFVSGVTLPMVLTASVTTRGRNTLSQSFASKSNRINFKPLSVGDEMLLFSRPTSECGSDHLLSCLLSIV